MLLLGYYQDASYDSDLWDKVEDVSGCYIIKREILKATKGEDFFYNDPATMKPVHVSGVSHEVLNYYVQLWDDFHYLKVLPHGKGTLSERRWVIEIIKLFEKAFLEIENHLEKKALKN